MRWRHVCAGKERCILRKSAFCTLGLTERRILRSRRDGKVHSVLIDSRKGALCDSQIAQTAPFRHAAAPGKCGATPRQPAGRVVSGSADLGSESGLTEKRILYPAAHGKTHSPSPHHQNPQFNGSEDRRMRFSVTFRNHPDCIALSRHLRSPLTAPSHVRGGHRSARRRLRASAQSKGIRPPARHGSRTRV